MHLYVLCVESATNHDQYVCLQVCPHCFTDCPCTQGGRDQTGIEEEERKRRSGRRKRGKRGGRKERGEEEPDLGGWAELVAVTLS